MAERTVLLDATAEVRGAHLGRVTCAEARAEACGAPIPVTKDHPLYQFMRDGDGDGRVCE